MIVPFRTQGTSSPSANSRIIVPETGEVLSSSKANFREAFLRGVRPPLFPFNLAFLGVFPPFDFGELAPLEGRFNSPG